jgi:ribose transport system substrate-binding protein
MKRVLICLVLGLAMVFGLAAQKKAEFRIAFSNNYAANSWRQQMLRDWQVVVDKAKGQGLVADAQAYTTNENSAAEQAAQIQNLILEGYDAIVLNAASPTALNGAVNLAAAAGIPVICFDGVVTSKNAYVINIDFGWYGQAQVEYIAKNLTTKGNLLEIRGLAGTSINDDIHNGIAAGLKKYPGLKVVGEVYGNWDEATAQKAVAGILPSLPKIDAVVDQGGDGYGAIQAFQAAERPIPMVMMGNRYDEMAIWKDLKDKSGYKTFSACSQPAAVQIAFWVALEILNGKKVPHLMNINPLVIPQEKLEWFLANTEKGGVATLFYPQSWTQLMISNVTAGKPAPADPVGQ